MDIEGNLWPLTQYEVSVPGLESDDYIGLDLGNMPDPISASVESLEMVYRFEVTDDAAIIKIDQHIGDFTDPETGLAIPELEGLGLTMNYWSSFWSYDLAFMMGGTEVDYTEVEGAQADEAGEIGVSPDEDEFVTINYGVFVTVFHLRFE